MKKNMGTADRIIRTLIGLSVGILYFAQVISGTWAIILGILAIVFIVSSFAGVCPMYMLFGIRTCKQAKADTRVKE